MVKPALDEDERAEIQRIVNNLKVLQARTTHMMVARHISTAWYDLERFLGGEPPDIQPNYDQELERKYGKSG
ncbi:hypothetical protein A2765_02940 [Candidatus Kaiserbacteria bacterium RIFCSPHIGHO2_01_FULL_56_24]|uniref:Uncharacterized protein n=1 Tax=Candidatus Kaiserbacteria bacterium RIFCSPHIGHO2_01_FULL_56_24 TaxID=1798487 RepID=A0A1F6DG08_9BACT|nr:MAG: hypothetical protein A2765_02940 [Candidatus Kaiserbacteria bacterium RIFCSPHIGHO2_01_FULL_56_24]